MSLKNLVILFLTLASLKLSALDIDKVVIWGHKLHSHTHSYIHHGFFEGFSRLGYKVYWFDDNDDTSNFDFSRTFFLTEGQVDKKIPVRDDCYYAVHYARDDKYDFLVPSGRYIDLKVYRKKHRLSKTMKEVKPYIFHDFENHAIMFPWATDLFPEAIERNKILLRKGKLKKSEGKMNRHYRINLKKIYWVGTIGGGATGNIEQLEPFIKACNENRVQWVHIDPWNNPVSFDENLLLIQKSFLAPAIVGKDQIEQEYIPCRILKNISYGKLGATNSETVYNFLNKKVVYNPDTHQLFYDMIERMKTITTEEMCELMDYIKDHHTYLDRVNQLLDFTRKLEEYVHLSN